MNIRISDLFDDNENEEAKKYAEKLQVDETSVDKEKVKRLVFARISGEREREQPQPARLTARKPARALLVAAVVAALLGSALAANAASGGKLFGAVVLDKSNRGLAKEPAVASMKEVPPGATLQPEPKPRLESGIIRPELLQAVNAASVTAIPVAAGSASAYSIPELLTGNGHLVIFTKPDGTGWRLHQGDKLTIRYELDLRTNAQSDPNGEYMEVGYVRNGTPVKLDVRKAPSFAYTLTADEGGDYYFYAENYSAGTIIVAKGTIASLP
ncbi:hypothetical protein [Paenibacillus cymbidii]|uniref:hypothetical protein n=1 Tax=Paenibacillus cymbidii TaxID=1639034 RepID=UPI001080F0A8|nr:hypothetical protein [Paenibacillus cymbidii]